MVTWILVAVAVFVVGVVLWRLDRRMTRHGDGADPVAGNPYAGQTNSPKTTDTGGGSL
jgi:hypothetical protein